MDGLTFYGIPDNKARHRLAEERKARVAAQAAEDRKIARDDWVGAFNTFGREATNTAALGIPRNLEALQNSYFSGHPFREEYQRLKEMDGAAARLNPNAAMAGAVMGIGAGSLVLPGIGGGLTATARAGRSALTGVGYATVSELMDSKDPVRAGVAALAGGVLGGGMGWGGEKLVGGVAAPAVEKVVDFVTKVVKRKTASTTILKPDGSLANELAAAANADGVDPAAAALTLQRIMRDQRAIKFGRSRGPAGGLSGEKAEDWITDRAKDSRR